jgi:hypothetical protein
MQFVWFGNTKNYVVLARSQIKNEVFNTAHLSHGGILPLDDVAQ